MAATIDIVRNVIYIIDVSEYFRDSNISFLFFSNYPETVGGKKPLRKSLSKDKKELVTQPKRRMKKNRSLTAKLKNKSGSFKDITNRSSKSSEKIVRKALVSYKPNKSTKKSSQ